MNIDNYTKMFKDLNPTQKLDGLTAKSDSIVASAKSALTGKSIPFC